MSKKTYKIEVIRTYHTRCILDIEADSPQEAREKADASSGDLTPGLQLNDVETDILQEDGKPYTEKS